MNENNNENNQRIRDPISQIVQQMKQDIENLSEYREDQTISTDWQCPACNTDKNANGNHLAGAWGVSLHVAYKVRRCSLHKDWAFSKVGEDIFDPSLSRKDLANELVDFVIEDNTERRKHESEAWKCLANELKASNKPRVQAFEQATDIEQKLHQFVLNTLIEAYGKEETGWWVEGIPEDIRKKCVIRREEALSYRQEAYYYTDFIDMKKIIDKNWILFKDGLSRIPQYVETKKDLLDALNELNSIRNNVAHARYVESDYDLEYLKWFSNLINDFVGEE